MALQESAPVSPIPQKKKSEAWLIPVIIVSVVLSLGVTAGAAAIYLNSRPMNKIEKAIEKNDIETVANLYGKLSKQEERDAVKTAMLNLAGTLSQDYINGSRTYEEVTEAYDLLGAEILSGNSDFQDLKEQVEAVYFEDQLHGTWFCEFDITSQVEELINYYSESMYFPLSIYITFNEDNTGSVWTKVDDTDAYVQSYKECAMYKWTTEYSMTEDEISAFMEKSGYSSVEEYINAEIMPMYEAMEQNEASITYTVDGSTLVIESGESEVIEVSFEDDKMILDALDGDFFDVGAQTVTFEKMDASDF